MFQPFKQAVGKGNGTVFSAGAPDADHKGCFPLCNVMGNQEFNHLFQFVQKLAGLRILHHVILYLFVIAGFGPQPFHVIGIGQKPHVKYQIGIRGNSIFKPKGHNGDKQVLIILILHKNLL